MSRAPRTLGLLLNNVASLRHGPRPRPTALFAPAFRGYAAAAKPKPKPKPKKSKAPKHSSPGPSASAPAVKSAATTAAAAPAETPAEKTLTFTEEMEEQSRYLRRLQDLEETHPTIDPWSTMLTQTYDVQMPYSVSARHRSFYPTWRAWRDQWLAAVHDRIKSAYSIWLLVSSGSFPEIDPERGSLWHKIRRWPGQALRVRSVAPGAWVAPMRAEIRDSYVALNRALAAGDKAAVRAHTTAAYQAAALRLLGARSAGRIYRWALHADAAPLRVLSLRAVEWNLATAPPRFGSRMLAHVLVRVDTVQSMEIYDRASGRVLHAPAAGSERARDGTQEAERRRVTEYLVFEKRMWYRGPWVVREQLYEEPGKPPLSV